MPCVAISESRPVPPAPWAAKLIEPVRVPWFACPGSRTARRDLRAGVRPPGARAPSAIVQAHGFGLQSSRRTVSGCNRPTSHCPWFVKTWRSSLCSLSVIRAPGQWVIAHHARQACACYCPMGRRSLIFARVSFSAFPVSRRACLSSGITYNVRRVLDTDSANDSNDLSRSIRESGPRGGGAMASALFRKNNPVKNDMA